MAGSSSRLLRVSFGMYTPSTILTKVSGRCPHTHGLMMAQAAVQLPARSTYRHGDLRRALLEAGLELARRGGPDAVVLRQATRRAGVVPNAAYRDFAHRAAPLRAGGGPAALAAVAGALEAELAPLGRGRRGAELARASLRAIGIAYLS